MWQIRVPVVIGLLAIVGGTIVAMAMAMAVAVAVGAVAATPPGFADPAFGAQWQAGEAIVPNFWGVTLAATPATPQEPYGGGMRLIQYFDKGRMEKGTDGSVTNGLLTTELITGKLQLGDSAFDTRQPAAIPVAGDPVNTGPTYAQVQANAAQLLAGTPAAIKAPVTRLLDSTGKLGATTVGGSDPQAITVAYDAATQHNVPTAFATYRDAASVAAIGLAIAEPFWTNVKVGGKATDVLVQAFERRVLTYTPGNADPYKVEMGNIGQHYYQWRYTAPPSTATATSMATATLAPQPTPAMPVLPAPPVTVSSPSASAVTAPAAQSLTAPVGTPRPAATPPAGGAKPGGIMPGARCKAGPGATVVVCTKT